MRSVTPKNKKGDAMNDSIIAHKLLKQLEAFLGRLSPHFHKPTAHFIGDMLYGIIAAEDIKLSRIVRALKSKTIPKKVEDRLSRMLSTNGLEQQLHQFIASEGAGYVHQNTLIILDPSDCQKPYAKKMEYLEKVWDGSKGEVGTNLGYHGCMAVACENGGRKPIPLHLRLWSVSAPGFKSERNEVKTIVETITKFTGQRGIFVYDRGGDSIEFYKYMIQKKLNFIVRLKERTVYNQNQKDLCGEVARRCKMLYREVIRFNHHGKERAVTLEFGVVPVYLPDLPDKPLHMVVVNGFGKSPMMLLTTLAKTDSRKALWQVVRGYLTRWRIEETIRHIKQSYGLEDIRLLKYEKLKAMAAILLTAVYFSMAWIGNTEKHAVIAATIAYKALRIHAVPEYHFYAIADGTREVLAHGRRWSSSTLKMPPSEKELTLFIHFGLDST